eukprot:1138768-Pelagomonas_calceolata.AAC.4
MRARTRTHIHTQCGDKLYVANAGDSRGVLCRGSTAVPLSEDHKPASERERSRIIAAGGFLSEIGGVCRCVARPRIEGGVKQAVLIQQRHRRASLQYLGP